MTNSVQNERAIRAAFDANDLNAVADYTLRLYGLEIRGFIAHRIHGRADIDEAFSMFVEDFWKGLAAFGWRSSMRTWCYTLAYHAAVRYAKAPHRRPERNERLSRPALDSRFVEHPGRSFDEDSRDLDAWVRSVRNELDDNSQVLLSMHVDQSMSFRDVARAHLGSKAAENCMLAREETRLRKAFSRLRLQLRRMAEKQGLVAG